MLFIVVAEIEKYEYKLITVVCVGNINQGNSLDIYMRLYSIRKKVN